MAGGGRGAGHGPGGTGRRRRARAREEEQRKLAEARAAEVRGQAARLRVLDGNRLLDERDADAAFASFAQALALDAGDPDRERPHRTRLATWFDRCPKLYRLWLHPGAGCAAPAPGERWAASGGDGAVRVWDVAAGRLARELAHGGRVTRVAFGPDGRLLATACEDGRGRVWEVESGRLAADLPHAGPVRWAAFGPDGKLVVTAGDDGTARVWDAAPDGRPVGEWVELAEVVSGRRAGPGSESAPLPVGDLLARWEGCRARCPAEFEHPAERVRNWHALEADRAEAAGEVFAAVWHLSRLDRVAPDPGRAGRLAGRHLRAGDAARESRDLTAAVREYTAAVALAPDDWRPVLARGLAHAARREFAPAEADFTRVLDLRAPGREGDVRLRRAEARLEPGRYAGAEDDLRVVRPLLADAAGRAEHAVIERRLGGAVVAAFGKAARPNHLPFAVRLAAEQPDRPYRDGDPIRPTVTSERAGHLYVLRCGPDGRVSCVFPRAGGRRSRSRPAVPGAGRPARLRAERPVHLRRLRRRRAAEGGPARRPVAAAGDRAGWCGRSGSPT